MPAVLALSIPYGLSSTANASFALTLNNCNAFKYASGAGLGCSISSLLIICSKEWFSCSKTVSSSQRLLLETRPTFMPCSLQYAKTSCEYACRLINYMDKNGYIYSQFVL